MHVSVKIKIIDTCYKVLFYYIYNYIYGREGGSCRGGSSGRFN